MSQAASRLSRNPQNRGRIDRELLLKAARNAGISHPEKIDVRRLRMILGY